MNVKKRFFAKRVRKRGKLNIVLQALLFALFFLPLFFIIHCRPSRISLLPLPSRIERIEGYASIKVTEERESVRSKFFFLFKLPHQGRIEVFHMMGRTIYQIIVNEEKAVFLLPSKKIYWQGEEEEIIDKLLGFRLNLYEMINLLSGKWEDRELETKNEKSLGSWNFIKDEKRRIKSGQRGEFHFEVKEFFQNTPFARILTFNHLQSRGRLKILNINLNQPIKKGTFSLSFLDKYKRKSWAEIEKILADEN
ncbi:MAG: hypothetical protein WBC02_03950 [Candidatus Aminicenantaceae bacterium]